MITAPSRAEDRQGHEIARHARHPHSGGPDRLHPRRPGRRTCCVAFRCLSGRQRASDAEPVPVCVCPGDSRSPPRPIEASDTEAAGHAQDPRAGPLARWGRGYPDLLHRGRAVQDPAHHLHGLEEDHRLHGGVEEGAAPHDVPARLASDPLSPDPPLRLWSGAGRSPRMPCCVRRMRLATVMSYPHRKGPRRPSGSRPSPTPRPGRRLRCMTVGSQRRCRSGVINYMVGTTRNTFTTNTTTCS